MNDSAIPVPSLVSLADGRRLAFGEYGDARGRPLVVLHGTPGGRTQAQVLHEPARRLGIRIIAPDRPGCGWSERRTGLSFMNYAQDVRELLDHLQVSRTAVAGISGGGAFALACARLLPDRISQAVLVCGMAPVPAKWRRGTPLQARLLFWLAAHLPSLAGKLMQHAYLGDPNSPALRRTIAQMPAADRRVLEREDSRELLFGAASRDSLRQGPAGAVQELALHKGALGFSLKDIAVPVRILHGDADRNVPLGVSQYLAAEIPSATLQVIPGAGHLFLFESPELLLKEL